MTGQTLAHYRILEKLGEGGMGVVYKAEDTKLKRTVALKLLPAHLTEHKDRFLREAQAAAALNHPNICTIHEIDEQHPFIAMEFLDGITLKDKIAHRPLPLAEALDIAIQTCQGLQHAHEKGVVHRDIKPANIMVTPAGQVKIMDFGLAQVGDRTRITKTGSSLGTPAYMSPEQVKGEPADRRTDIWSLGVTLYEMLTGRLPFPGDSEQAVSFGIVHTNPEPPTALRSGLPLELDRILAKALAKNPEQRYQNISDLAVDLRAITVSRPAPKKQRARWPLALAAALVVSTAGYFVWRAAAPSPKIQSIAILPLRTLSQEAADSFLGLGIADALITKIGQLGQLQVRPFGAIRRYAKGENDPLDAGRQLNAEVVLDGSLQQSGTHLRVSVHLLRTASGETIWTQSFDINAGEVFAMQDDIAKQIAAQLRLKLDPTQRQDFEKRATSNSEAFQLYSKALYHLDKRIRGNEIAVAVELLKRAVEVDPSYSLARAQLGYAYALLGLFEAEDPKYVDLARTELLEAEKLDPRIPQIHVARSVILYSRWGNWNVREAIIEMRTARKLDPNAGYADLSYLYWHIGLEELGEKQDQLLLASDPQSMEARVGYIANLYQSLLVDRAAALEKRLFNREPDVWFYLTKGMIKEAEPLIEKAHALDPAFPKQMRSRVDRAYLLALKEDRKGADELLSSIESEAEKLPRLQPFHHISYRIAEIRGRLGDGPRAAHWLQITVDTGFPHYPMMERDRMLDPVRNHPAVAKILASVKSTWEGYKREFGTEEQ